MNDNQPSVPATETILRFREVCHSYGKASASSRSLDGIELSLAAGESLALVGESGSGKTTALRLCLALERPESGSVEVWGQEASAWDRIRLRRSVGYVIQGAGLFPHLDVAENIGLVCKLEGWSEARVRERVTHLLEAMQLDPEIYAQRFPAQLSGGQLQRVGVARALALDPQLLLFDEPFGALDALTRRRLQRDFLTLQAQHRRSMILVTHDLEEAFHLAGRVAILRAGRLEQVGTREELTQAPASEYVRQLLGEFAHVD